ncbi:alpha/beta hydrolase [Nocardia sputi]|uniref:alpha/beta hydrolase n=1 Tax=Nocardia sputi TaxID=2943705 RepID=UPI0020BD5BAE|nr:alpha/beta hydrolase [Nocardia sputi]
MITHPDLHRAAITTAGGARLSVLRLGPETGPATIVYLHNPFTSPGYWGPLTAHLHTQFDGRISQVTYHQRPAGHTTSGSLTVSGTGDLDAVLHQVGGTIVVVAHSAAARLVLSWMGEYPRRARTVAGIVLLNPALEFPTIPVDPARRVHDELLNHFYRTPRTSGRPWRGANDPVADRIHVSHGASVAATYGIPALTDTTVSVWRCISTWMLTGTLDPLMPPRRCQALAERVWADYDCVPGAGHSLPYVDPRRASQPILAALEVAYRTHLQDGGEPW